MNTNRIDPNIIKDSLIEFTNFVRKNNWHGREREAVSLFVTGFLAKQIKNETGLYDTSQIVIEGAVPQIIDNGKKHVNKDLLIWDKPNKTCWDEEWHACYNPECILEWKVYRPNTQNCNGFCEHDVEWLKKYTKLYPDKLGFAVALDLHSKNIQLTAGLAVSGGFDTDWLKC